MKDQVENLKKRGVAAETLYSGQSTQEAEWILNAAVHGRLKFLYVSPERCTSAAFRAHFEKMQVCLLAVDEAHCISQWGYDFRPPYLRIAELRRYFPLVPLLALTATATPDVVEDIQDKLQISPHKVFQKSFRRENLIYSVVYDEDKRGRIERILKKIKGCGIVYVRSRRKTGEIAAALQERGISATSYHAGLSHEERNTRQQAWIDNKVRVMVATNAFGMGIDKPDVRWVVHWDLPDTLEAYFQEAGRAGRDEKRAFALMLHHPSDIVEAEENFAKSYPSTDFIARVYEALCNYFELAPGAGEGSVFAFNLREFCTAYRFPASECFSALSFLEKEGYVRLSDTASEASRVHLRCAYDAFYRYEVEHAAFAPLLQFLLRRYGGRLFSDFTPVSESEIAKGIARSEADVKALLTRLQQEDVLDYSPATQGATLSFTRERRKAGKYMLSPETYLLRKENARRKLDAVIGYVRENTLCRNRYLIQYFGEDLKENCGFCDVCLEKRAVDLSPALQATLFDTIKPFLAERPRSLRELLDAFPAERQEALSRLWRTLLAEERLVPAGFSTYRLKE